MSKEQIFAIISCFVCAFAIGLNVSINGWSGLLSIISAAGAVSYMYWAMAGE